jgi:hypothetical protein
METASSPLEIHLQSTPFRRALNRQIVRRLRKNDRLYEILAPWECGAFDGGCLVCAIAFQQALGVGEL